MPMPRNYHLKASFCGPIHGSRRGLFNANYDCPAERFTHKVSGASHLLKGGFVTKSWFGHFVGNAAGEMAENALDQAMHYGLRDSSLD